MERRVGPRVLVVDDDRSANELFGAALSRRGFDVTLAGSGLAALTAMSVQSFDAVITDALMAGLSGVDLCGRITASYPGVPVFIATGFASLDLAVAAIRAGARDFFVKPVDLDIVSSALTRAIDSRRVSSEVEKLSEKLHAGPQFDEIVGASDAMRTLCELLERISGSDSSVLITGDTGTGKEVVARALHRRSPRRTGPFVAINCAAMPEPLLESELFGHLKGAFTDARTAHAGLFVQASQGTLFLDEVGEMPMGLQPKLLRALQERRVRPVGSSTEVAFDVRLIAATNRNLEEAVAAGHFRRDLYYRLDVIRVAVPPLQARGTDVLLLAQHFVESSAAVARRPVRGIAPQAAEKLLAYTWPGNVRELQNTIERAVALCRGERIDLDDLPDRIRSARQSRRLAFPTDSQQLVPLDALEREYIQFVVDVFQGNKTLAAERLGIDRKTLARKLNQKPTS